MTARRLVWALWPVISTVVAATSGLVVGRAIGCAQERQRAQSNYESMYVSCQALSVAVERSLEANRLHMLYSHDMEFVEGKGWVRR
jgi:phage head maturation protease